MLLESNFKYYKTNFKRFKQKIVNNFYAFIGRNFLGIRENEFEPPNLVND